MKKVGEYMREYSVMEYLYRDANNFKGFGQILLTGSISGDYIAQVESLLDSGEFFVAEQVNIPTLYSQLWKYSNGQTIADHAFHELSRFRPAISHEIESMAIWGEASILLDDLYKIDRQWDCKQSIHG